MHRLRKERRTGPAPTARITWQLLFVLVPALLAQAALPLHADQQNAAVRLSDFSYDGIVAGLLRLVPSAADGRQASAADGRQASAADGRQASAADGRQASAADGRQASAADGRWADAVRVPTDQLLTAEQQSLLVPVARALSASAFPTPAVARQVLRTVSEVLTRAQRTLLDELRRQMSENAAGRSPAAGQRPAAFPPSNGRQQAFRPPSATMASGASIEQRRLAMVNFLLRRLSGAGSVAPPGDGTGGSR